jgi:hypothetical protein
MSAGKNPADKDPSRLYPAAADGDCDGQSQVQAGTRCAFCWFVLTTYPALRSMTERDRQTYKAHLQQAHGLVEDIQP